MSLDGLLVEIREWANATFTQATPASKAEHLRREAEELCAAPTDIAEMADIFVLLAHASDGHDLAAAVAAKLAKNRARVWSAPDDRGVVEHVRGDGTPGPAREDAPDDEGAPSPAEAGRWEVKCEPGLYAYTVSNGLRTYRTEYLGNAERLATWLNAASGDSGGPREAGPSDEMEKLKAHLVIVENGYREAARYILNYGRADHADWKARAQRILDTTPGGCTPWLSELLALRAELGRAPNVWEEAAKVCEEAQAEMKGTRWSGAAACIRALRARADAERPPQETT